MNTNPVTIEELLKWNTEQEISYQNLHGEVIIDMEDKDHDIKIPLNGLMEKYRYFLAPYIREIIINDEEIVLYRYNPKKLSLKLYNTTQYWSTLMMVNNCISKMDFCTGAKLMIMDPNGLRAFTNEVLILEGKLT